MAHSLEGCVSSLRETLSLLGSSISTLDAGVNDFPRLSKVLQTTRHFELVAESDLRDAQAALLSEILPEVTTLLNRVDGYLDKLERREQSLMAKAELQSGRLSQPVASHARSLAKGGSSSAAAAAAVAGKASASNAAAGAPLQGLEALKMKQLRQKKERLSFAIDRLQMQAQQRERQLRKSMAAQPQILDDIDF